MEMNFGSNRQKKGVEVVIRIFKTEDGAIHEIEKPEMDAGLP